MSKYNADRNFIDDMVDEFGYDYVIGYCLCSEYDLRKRAGKEEDHEKAMKLLNTSRKYKTKAEKLTRERFDYGL